MIAYAVPKHDWPQTKATKSLGLKNKSVFNMFPEWLLGNIKIWDPLHNTK